MRSRAVLMDLTGMDLSNFTLSKMIPVFDDEQNLICEATELRIVERKGRKLLVGEIETCKPPPERFQCETIL